jgi:hypothetical protein
MFRVDVNRVLVTIIIVVGIGSYVGSILVTEGFDKLVAIVCLIGFISATATMLLKGHK